MHWRYETVNIAPYLVEGENVITAEVFNMGEYRPAAQFSYQTAFIFQAQGPWGSTLNTPGKWLIHQNLAYDPIEVTREVVRGYYVAGPTESIRGSDFPWGWKNPEFDDSHWSKPAVITKGVGRGYMHGVPWMLVPRNIPQMEQRPEPISLVRTTEGIELPDRIHLRRKPFDHSSAYLLQDSSGSGVSHHHLPPHQSYRGPWFGA